MAIDPLSMMGESLLDQVDAALKGMVEDLTEADRGVIGVIRQAALQWDMAVAADKGLSAMTYLAYVTKGLESLGGTVAARKALGKKPEKPKQGLADVRKLRAVPDAPAKPARKPRAAAAKPPAKRRQPPAKGA